MPYRCSRYCSLNIECLHFAALWKYIMFMATMKLDNNISLAVHALSKSSCLVPRVQTNTKFGFSFTLFFFLSTSIHRLLIRNVCPPFTPPAFCGIWPGCGTSLSTGYPSPFPNTCNMHLSFCQESIFCLCSFLS